SSVRGLAVGAADSMPAADRSGSFPGTMHTPVSGSQKSGMVVLFMVGSDCVQPGRVQVDRVSANRMYLMPQALSIFTLVMVSDPARGLSLKRVTRSPLRWRARV